MLKAGLIGLAIAASGVALLFLLGLFGVAQFGPCGPASLFGFVLFFGSLLCGAVSLCLAIFGLIAKGFQRFRKKEMIPPSALPGE